MMRHRQAEMRLETASSSCVERVMRPGRVYELYPALTVPSLVLLTPGFSQHEHMRHCFCALEAWRRLSVSSQELYNLLM